VKKRCFAAKRRRFRRKKRFFVAKKRCFRVGKRSFAAKTRRFRVEKRSFATKTRRFRVKGHAFLAKTTSFSAKARAFRVKTRLCAPTPLRYIAPVASSRVIRRVVLEHASRAQLARFLEKHGAAFFAAHGLSLDELARSSTRDRVIVARVFDLVHDTTLDPAAPAGLRAALAALDALATHGAEAILRADTQGVLPRATYGDEDMALVVLLDHPELAGEARREADAEEVQRFMECEPKEPRALVFGADQARAFADALGKELALRDRTKTCETHHRRAGDVVTLEILHGRRPKTFDKIDTKTLEIDAQTDTHGERAYVEIDLASGRVAIHAARGVKELICEVLGVVLAGDARFFRPARVYDLSPFANLPAALSTEDASPRLTRVELHAIHVLSGAGTLMSYARARRDLLGDEGAKDALFAALRSGRPVAVKLYLFIEGRKSGVRLELSTKGEKNLVDFERSDPDVVAIVRGYLRARGVLREVAPSEPGAREGAFAGEPLSRAAP